MKTGVSNWQFRRRLTFITLVVFALWGILAWRLVSLHVLDDARKFTERARDVRAFKKTIPAMRGAIVDRRGSMMALDLNLQKVCVDPKALLESGHAEPIARLLALTLSIPYDEVWDRVNRPGRRYECVKQDVSDEIVNRLRRMQLDRKGVFFDDRTTKRNYPQGSLAAHVVGFSNTEGDGSSGVELKYDKYLKGRPGYMEGEKDGLRKEIYERRVVEVPPVAGADVHLTIDQNVQYMVERHLEAAVHSNAARSAWAVVQRVRTGEILAMTSFPNFDLNEYGKSPPAPMLNRAVGYVYEPGSTFKVVAIAGALNEKLVEPEQIFDTENGVWIYAGRPLRDYHGYARLSVADIVKKSSNIGTAKIALILGNARFEKYLRAFGVGRPLGIDLPGEEAGILHDRSKWAMITPTRVAIGQGVGVTSLQVLGVMCALANEGRRMKPYVVRKVVDASGHVVYDGQPEELGRPVSPDTARRMCDLLQRVTEKGGTGTRACVAGYGVAGKTGTAQKPEGGRYSDSKYFASFVGFLPARRPEIGMIVVIDEPQPIHTGGMVAAPVFGAIAEEVARYLDIPADDAQAVVQVTDEPPAPEGIPAEE